MAHEKSTGDQQKLLTLIAGIASMKLQYNYGQIYFSSHLEHAEKYRLIHRIIPCNNWLYKLKVTDTNQRTYRYCSSNKIDDIKHFVVTCDPVLKFWDTFATWWNIINFKKLDPLTEVNIMLGFDCHLVPYEQTYILWADNLGAGVSVSSIY